MKTCWQLVLTRSSPKSLGIRVMPRFQDKKELSVKQQSPIFRDSDTGVIRKRYVSEFWSKISACAGSGVDLMKLGTGMLRP